MKVSRGTQCYRMQIFDVLIDMLKESNATPIVEFLGLLATGMTSQPLHYYLEQVLTEQVGRGRKLSRSMHVIYTYQCTQHLSANQEVGEGG
jgi:hypothetical protein